MISPMKSTCLRQEHAAQKSVLFSQRGATPAHTDTLFQASPGGTQGLGSEARPGHLHCMDNGHLHVDFQISPLWFRYLTPVSWCTGQSAGACRAGQGGSRARADASTGPVRTYIVLLQAGRLASGSKGKRCLQHWHLTRWDGGKEMGSGPPCREAWRTESPSCSAAKQTPHSCHFTVIYTEDQTDKFLPGWLMHSHIMKCIS